MAHLKVSPSGQVYDIDLSDLKITRDQGGGYYLHGRGHFIHFPDLQAAEARKREIEVSRMMGGERP